MRKKGRNKPGGTKRMQEFGYKQVQVWFDQSELALVQAAADKDSRRLATWVRLTAVQAAGGKLPRA